MGQLTNLYVSQSYQGLLKMTDSSSGLTNTLQTIQTGDGDNSPLQMSLTQVNISGSLSVNGLPIEFINTGSLVTTSSFNAYTGSNDARVNSLIAQTGSYVTETESGSFVTNVTQSPFVGYNSIQVAKGNGTVTTLTINNVLSSSFAQNAVSASWAPDNSNRNGLITTGSVGGSQSITGSLNVSNDVTADDITALGSVLTDRISNESSTILTIEPNTKLILGNSATTSSLYGQLELNNSKVVVNTGDIVGVTNLINLDTAGVTITGSVNISGSLDVTGEITALSASITYLETIYQTSSVIFSSGSNILGDEAGDTQTLWGTVNLPTGPLNVSGSTNISGSLVVEGLTYSSFDYNSLNGQIQMNATGSSGKIVLKSENVSISSSVATTVTGSLIVTGGITGSLQGTASFATNALSSSHAINADTASFVNSAVTSSIAFDLVVNGKCDNPGGLTKGTIVRITGAVGDNPLFNSASWEDDFNSANTLGMLTANVAYNGFANIVVQGTVIGINTDNMTAGDLLYLSSSGQYTTSSVPAPYHEVRLGQVLRPQLNNGSAYISIDNGYELSELHDVDITSPVVGDLLVYRSGSYGQWVNEDGAQLGFATTGSNIFKGDQVISGSLVTNTLNNGILFINSEAFNSGSVKTNISSSNAVSQSNLAFGSPGGPLLPSVTGSVVVSGSNNILQTAVRASTIGQGTYGYIGGNTNLVVSIPTITTSSLLRPNVNNNNLNGQVAFAFTTSSLAAPDFIGNNVFGGVTINHQSSSLFFSNNIVGISLTSNANRTTLDTIPTISSNTIIGSAQSLNHNSSSINYSQNVGAINVTNNYSSSISTAVNNINVTQNFAGGSNQQLFVSGSNSGTRRAFNSNFLMGRANIVNSFHSGSPFTGGHLVATALIGQELIVSASHTSQTVGGTVIVGRYNATGSLQESSQDAVFVVGTGTGAGNRRNAIHVDNGSNVRITGSLNVSGSMTLGYNDGVDNITSISQGAGTILYRNAGKYTTAIGEFAGTQTKFADGTNNILLGGFNSQFATGSQNFLALPTGGNFKSGSINIIIGNTENITSGSQNILIGSMPSSLGPQVDAHFIIKGQSETNSYLFKSGSGANVPIQIGFPVQITGSLVVSGSATITGSVQGNVLPLTVLSNTASLNLNNGNFFELALTGSSDIRIEPSNIKPGQTINIKLNTTGSGTVSFPTSVKQPSGSAYVPTTTVGTDIITMVSFDSTNLFVANVKNLI